MPDYDLGTARGRIYLDASSLGRASAAFATLGKSLLGFSAVAVGGFAYVVKKAADFEKVLSAVKAVTNATDSQMKQLSDTALTLASNSAFGAEAIAGAFEDLGKAGITVEQILGGAAEATVRLAEAAGDELPGGITQGAEIIANALKTFEAGADQANHFADVLVAAAASSTLSVDDIATSMRYAGPIANQLGLNIDDLATTLAILGDRGIKGSTAGTSLRGVLLSLSPTSKKAKEALKELGLITKDGTNQFFDMNGALKPIPEVMQLLGNATKDLSEEQKVQAFNTIFQRRAMNAALILAEQGAEGFENYGAAIAALNASDIAATKLDNLSGDMTKLRNAVDALVISVGLEFQDMLRGWVQGITGVVQWLSNLDPQLLANGLRIIAITGAVAGVLGAFSLFISAALRIYKNFVILKEAITLVSGAVRLLTTSLLLNPWFLLAAAVAALGFALYKMYQRGGPVKDFIDNLIATITPAIEAIQRFVSNFVDQLSNLFDVIREGDDVAQGLAEVLDSMFGNTGALVGPIRTIVNLVIQFFEAMEKLFNLVADGKLTLNSFSNVMDEAFGNTGKLIQPIRSIGNFITQTAIPAITKFGEVVAHVFSIVVAEGLGFALKLFRDMSDFIIEIMPQLQEAVSRVWTFIYNKISGAINAARFVITNTIDVIMALWRAWGDDLENIVGTVWNGIQETIENTMQFVQGIIQIVLALINGDWGKVWEGIKDVVGSIWDQIGNIISTAVGIVRSLITGFVSTIQQVWNYFWGGIYTVVTDTGAKLISFVGNTLGTLVNLFTGLPGKITAKIGDLAGTLFTFFSAAFDKARAAISIKAGDIFRLAQDLPGRILRGLGNIKDFLFDAGKKIIQGLINGIESMFGAIGDTINKGMRIITDRLPGSPVKKGPLQVLNQGHAGKLIVDMLSSGITSKLSSIARAFDSIPTPLGSVGSASGGSGSAPIVSLHFNGPYGPDFEDRMRVAVSDPTLLQDITQAVKAGRR